MLPKQCSIETTHNLVKVKLGIKVMKLAESLISWEVTVGQGSECHLTFERGRLLIADKIPVSTIFYYTKKYDIERVKRLRAFIWFFFLI